MASAYGSEQVVRTRLINELCSGAIGIVEAAAGYGKSVLASQYRQRLGIATAYVALGSADRERTVLIASIRRALANARLSDLLAATEVGEPDGWADRLLDALGGAEEGVLLVLDDVHHIQTPEAGRLVLRLAQGLPPQHRMLIAGRSVAPWLEPVWRLPDAVGLDTQWLAFTAQEAELLLRGRSVGPLRGHDLRLIIEATDGWATALVLAAAAQRSDGRAADQSRTGSDAVASPLRGILRGMAPAERDAATQLAHVPLLAPELCDAVSGRAGTFEALVSGGIPLARTGSGWWEMPSPVAARLQAQSPMRDETARAAAAVYAVEGEQVGALRVLLEAGLGDDAASLLASLGPSDAEDLGLGVVRDVVESLPEEVCDRHPRVLLHLARLAETAQQSELRAHILQRAIATVSASEQPALARELWAERARELMWDERTREQARSIAQAVISKSEPDELVARARALDVLGRLSSWFSASGPQPQAETLLRESARLARRLGQATWTAQALVALGAGFYFALCRYERALEVLDEAIGELAARNRYRAMVHCFRADTLVELARWDEAESAIAQMREIGSAVGERWVLAYAAWLEAALASYRGDGARAVRAYREIDRHRDAWFDQPAGGECLAQVADHLSRAGEHTLALECLARARAKMEGNERIVRVHGAAVLARSGDPEAAQEAIAEALEGPAAEPHELWPLHLQRAHVARAQGSPDAGPLAAAAFEYCHNLGLVNGPLIREPQLGSELLPLAVGAGSPAARELDAGRTRASWSMRILGGFSVTHNGVAVSLPAGYPARAVRIVAALGGRIHAETLIEIMWPGAAPGLARNRLRNLMSRVRGAAGDLLVRQGEMVQLAPGCELDAQRFEAAARAALTSASNGDRNHGVALARTALEHYHGELLPEDRFEEWALAPRERFHLYQLELLDLLVSAAEHGGEIDEAIRLLHRAIDAEPHDEFRHVRLVRLLTLQGRTGSARSALRRARAALRAGGGEAELELIALERELGLPEPPDSGTSAPPKSIR